MLGIENFFTYFLIVLLAASLVLYVITRIAAGNFLQRHHNQKTSFFQHFPVEPGDFVFLGDSITDGARWDEIFPGVPVKNRGINADVVSGVLARMDEILPGRPAAIFILIGTNDLPWYVNHSDKHILENYNAILASIKAQSPGTRVFVQSILPRKARYARRIRALNAGLETLARRFDYTYIELFPHFAGPNGGIRPELTNDQIHLLGNGYVIWKGILTPYIESVRDDQGAVLPAHKHAVAQNEPVVKDS